MVDWATVAASGIASSLGILVAVLMERRRDLVERIQAISQRLESLDERSRSLDRNQSALQPGAVFFNDLATKAFKKALKQVEDE